MNEAAAREDIHEEYFGHEHVTRITPSRGWLSLDLRELWAYRELLALLAWRDVSVRYKQSVVGVGWAVIQPLLNALLFTVIFGRFANLPSDGVPYAVFTFCALLPWTYFSRSLTDSSDSLVGASNLVTKVYFPRLVLPLSKVISGLVDFAVSSVVLAGLLFWYGIAPSAGVFFLPLFLVMAMLAALGAGLWLTALNVKYRDVRFVVPFLAQFWMYASPVAYAASLVPERWRWAYALNPMVGVIDGFRWALLGTNAPEHETLAISAGVVLLLLVSGLFYFKRMERTFADII